MSRSNVDSGNPLGALFLSVGRDFRDLLRNPLAFVGGVGGLALTSLALFLGGSAVANAAGDESAEEEEDAFEIDFTPGTLAKLGQKIDEKELPQKIIVQETRAPDPVEEEPVKDSVTTDEKAVPTEPPKEKPKDITKDKPTVKDNKDKKLPTSKTPTHSNTPYQNDLPTVQQDQGDPFGDPDGWDDLTRDGIAAALGEAMIVDEGVSHFDSFAKNTAAFFKISRSIVNRWTSSRSGVGMAVMSGIVILAYPDGKITGEASAANVRSAAVSVSPHR